VHTSWINPNPAYEEAVQHYIARDLDTQTQGAFLDDFLMFQRRLSHYGLFNSLAQTLLKITTPGVPDTYQGTELWDLSLVDPDNRRAVDYKHRYDMLRILRERLATAGEDRRALVQELLTIRKTGALSSTSRHWLLIIVVCTLGCFPWEATSQRRDVGPRGSMSLDSAAVRAIVQRLWRCPG